MSLKVLAEDHLDMTQGGLIDAMKNQTLRVDKLEKIARALNVPVSLFFKEEEEALSMVNEGNMNYIGKSAENSTQNIATSDSECRQLLNQAYKDLADCRALVIELMGKK
jgi:hypothetical protein